MFICGSRRQEATDKRTPAVMWVRKVRSLAKRDRPITEVEYPMVKEPKPSWSTGLFKSKLFRFLVLLSVILSSLPNFSYALASSPDLLTSTTSDAAQFII